MNVVLVYVDLIAWAYVAGLARLNVKSSRRSLLLWVYDLIGRPAEIIRARRAR